MASNLVGMAYPKGFPPKCSVSQVAVLHGSTPFKDAMGQKFHENWNLRACDLEEATSNKCIATSRKLLVAKGTSNKKLVPDAA